ncbi:MAG: translocation/assembly module TamB domain-containing protein [Bryobacteraceae bacterium]
MRIRVIRIAGLTIGGLIIAGVALLHTPPMKRFALANLQTALAAQGIRLEASGLDFNLFSLRASLRDIVVQPEPALPPLAKLDSMAVKLSILDLVRGRLVVSGATLRRPEVWIVINADGLSNLPKSKTDSATGETFDYLVESLVAADGSLQIDDRRAGLKITLPRWDLRVDGNRLTNRHRIQLDTKAPGSTTIAGKSYPVEFLGTVIDAGTKDARIEKLALRTAGASLSGNLAILDFDQLGLKGTVLVDAQPGQFMTEASGDLHAELAISGTAKAPIVTGQVKARNAGWQTYRDINLEGDFAYDSQAEAVTAKGLSVSSPFASLKGDGRVSVVATGDSSFQGTVQRLAVNRFVPGLASSASGTVQAQWKGLDFAGAGGTAAVRLNATRRAAKGVYPVTGNIRVQRAAGDTVVRVDRAALSGLEATGTIRMNSRDRLSGQLTISTANVAAQPYAESPVSGGAKLNLIVSGTVQKPAANFTVDAPNLRAETITGIAVSAAGSLNANRVDFDRATVNLGGQSLTASGWVGLSGASAPLAIQAEVANGGIRELLAISGNAETPLAGVINLRANISGTIDRPLGDAAIDITDVEAYGERLGRVTATARFDRISATVPDLLIEKSPDEKVKGRGTYEFETQRFTASLQSDTLKLTKGTVAINAEGSGTVRQPAVTANLKGELNDVGPLQIKAELNGKSLHVEAEASKQNLKADARGTTLAPYPFTLRMEARETDLASLPAGMPEGLEGKITATVNATGEGSNWRRSEASIQAEQISLSFEGQPVRTDGPLTATFKNGALDLRPVTLVGPGTRITAEGQVPGELRIDGAVNIEIAQKALRPSEAATGELTISGTVQSTRQAGRYSLEPRLTIALTNGSYVNPSISPVTGAQLQARLADGSLQLGSLEAMWANAKISGKGELPLGLLSTTLPIDFARKGGPASAELSVKGLNFAQLKGVPETLGGQVSFTAAVDAARPELDALRGEVRFEELRMQAGKFNLAQEVPSVLRVNAGTIQVERFTLTGPESKVTLAGTAQLTGAQALQLRLESNVDLALMSAFTTAVRAQGATAVSLNVGGTLNAPEATGYLQVTDADASVTSPRLQAEKVNLRLDLAKDRVTVSRLTGTLNGGTLQGEGGVSFRGAKIESADLRVSSTGVYLDFPANLKSMSNANIFLRSAGGRFLLGGNVAVVDGSYTEPVNLDQGVLNALNSSGTPEVSEERSALLDRLDFGIAIKTENPVVVDNNLAKAELEMDARLTGTYYRPGLVGRVTIDEGGSLNLNERKYLVDRGVLTFTDENRIDPSFDIVARTQASGYDVTLTVQGSGKERETTLTSDPPLPEPDIAAVLLTGRTLDELSGQEIDVAKEQVLSYLTGRVGGTLGRGIEQATGISQVRIEPNLIANESDPSARLTIGQDFTRQLSLIYSMNLTDSGDQILVGQYDLSKRFRTRALKQSDNTYRFDFSRKQEFGGVKPEPSSTAEREQKKVGEVQFSGERIFTDEQLAKWLAARRGKTYDFFKVRRGVERVTNKHAGEGHLEARIRLNRTNRDGQVDLDLSVEAGPKVDFVYEGFQPSGGLRKKIREQWLSGVFDAQRADDAVSTLREELAREGYLANEIEYTIKSPEPNRKQVVFDVRTGDKFDSPKLVFAGAKDIEEAELRKLLRDQKLSLAALSRPEPAIDLIVRFYRDRGYLDAKVAKPEIVLNAPARTATIIYPIVEGPLYEVGRLTFSGNQAYRQDELLRAVTLEAGYDYLPELREESLTNLRELYGRRGFNDVDLTYSLDRRADGKVDVNFNIAEGPQSVVRAVTVNGNDETSSGLIRSQMELRPGDPLDSQILSRSRRNLYSTGAYSLIDIQRTALDPVDGKKAVDLGVNVREIRPFQVNYGGYFDTERGPGGIVDFANHNSLGSARVIGVRARYDADLQEGRLYFTQPLLRRFPVRTTGSTFVRREVREGFNTDRLGFSVLQEARFGKAWILNYGYRLERTRTYDRGPDPIFDATLRVAPFTASLSRDTRDDLLDATRGSLLSQAVEYAPTFSGSQLNFAKYFGQYFRYFSFDKPQLLPLQKGVRKSRLIFATGVRVGMAGGLNGQDLIPGRSATNRVSLGERFFAGGGTTIRGFAQDGVGPRIFDGVSPAGGNALFILNNEMRFPIAGIFDGVAFVDAGNVYDQLGDFRPWSVRKAGGLGIRIRTPYFLIRFDYGIKLDRRPGEPLGRPFFSIGQAF